MNVLYSLSIVISLSGSLTPVQASPNVAPAITISIPQDFQSIPIDTTLIYATANDSVIALYRKAGNKTIWNTTSNREAYIGALRTLSAEGLQADDFWVHQIMETESRNTPLDTTEQMMYDVLLSQSFYTYIGQISNGKADPKELYTDWDLKPNPGYSAILLLDALSHNTITKTIEDHKQKHLIYLQLQRALQLLDSYPEDHTAAVVLKTRKILPKESNTALIAIKKKLVYWHDLNTADTTSNHYDHTTVKAVKQFQKRHGLKADGIIGNNTVVALNITKATRREQLIANLERWRWYPRSMGQNYLIINIPDYSLYAIKNEDTLRIHKVIVGKPERKTPILSSKLNYIVYNPTWTVPPTILNEDIIPATSRNFYYLQQKNIKVYDQNNNQITASTWKKDQAKNYRYVQSPGDFNSLGRMKINFPNPYMVYLHDTNHRSSFGSSYRALSSGCVRVEDPIALSEYLLDAKNWSKEKIQSTLETLKTKNASITDDIYVHQLYWTAWMDDSEKLQFREDIYNLDSELFHYLNH